MQVLLLALRKHFQAAICILAGWSLAFLALAQTPTANEPRLALLIGNATYKSSPLANPVNDVRLMESALKESGFTVIKAENASIREMRRLVRDFGDKLKASGGVGLFYFAGHGVQVRGENYLVSTDSDIRNEDEVADDAVNASVVLEKMQSAGNRMNLIILDACRNNPFAVKSRSASSGLANMSAPSGSLVAYSTAPGSVASDGNGKNGLYTEHLAKTIRQPGLPVEEVFKRVRAAVRKDSSNQQTPWENTALEGQFYFRAPPTIAATEPLQPPSRSDPAVMELALWDSVKGANTPGELQAYLNRYPGGVFADVAKARLQAMGNTASPQETAKEAAQERAKVEAERKAAADRAKAEADRQAASLAKEDVKVATVSPTPTPVTLSTSRPPVGDVIGTLVMKDTFGKETRQDVTVQAEDAEKTVYSTGDVVARDGKVLQVRIGEVVLRVVSGALWTIPLKAGTSGEAKINRADVGYEAPGKLSWRAVSIGNNKVQIVTEVVYAVFSASSTLHHSVAAVGKWAAIYGDRHLPESFSSDIRAGGAGLNNVTSANLQRR
jgi:uncharacterized caspase-like protein